MDLLKQIPCISYARPAYRLLPSFFILSHVYTGFIIFLYLSRDRYFKLQVHKEQAKQRVDGMEILL